MTYTTSIYYDITMPPHFYIVLFHIVLYTHTHQKNTAQSNCQLSISICLSYPYRYLIATLSLPYRYLIVTNSPIRSLNNALSRTHRRYIEDYASLFYLCLFFDMSLVCLWYPFGMPLMW